MIRQAISCDVCGAEKKQTNHWFVACEQAGELRLGGWSSRMRQRPGAKHLCGQTCLHKLVDEYMARIIDGRNSSPAPDLSNGTIARRAVDASLTSPAAFRQSVPAPIPNSSPSSSLVQFPPPMIADTVIPDPLPPQAEPPQYASRRWRAEAWERERIRESRTSDRHLDLAPRRKGL